MGRIPVRAKLVLDAETRAELESIAKSRTDGQARIERAKVLLAYHGGERVTALAEAIQTNRPKIGIEGAVQGGVRTAWAARETTPPRRHRSTVPRICLRRRTPPGSGRRP